MPSGLTLSPPPAQLVNYLPPRAPKDKHSSSRPPTRHTSQPTIVSINPTTIMSVESATAQMANTTLTEPSGTAEGASVGAGGDKPINASQNEAVIASAAEGRRLYIGNLAYATTEGELKEFFKEYLVYVCSCLTSADSHES